MESTEQINNLEYEVKWEPYNGDSRSEFSEAI